jgi:hypothetical protein
VGIYDQIRNAGLSRVLFFVLWLIKAVNVRAFIVLVRLQKIEYLNKRTTPDTEDTEGISKRFFPLGG